MKLLVLLIKIFVSPYYQRNTGFFLFFFFLFFGTVDPNSIVAYHLSLIQSILSSYITLSCVMIIWLLYNYKCNSFFFTSLKSNSGQYLYQLQAVNLKKQFLFFTIIQAILLMPVLGYIIVISNTAIQQDQLIQAYILAIFSLCITLGSSFYYCVLINASWIIPKRLLPNQLFTSSKPKRFLFYLLHFSVSTKKKQLLTLKLLSIIIFYIALVWNHNSYDHDTLVLFLLIILLSHSLLAFQYVQFIEKQLLFLRNLPLSSLRIFAAYYITFAALFLPELIYIFLTGHTLLLITQLLGIYFILVHTLVLFSAVQYSGAIDRNEYVKIIFGICFISIFFLNGEDYITLSIIMIALAAILFFSGYSQYEALNEEV